MRTTTVSEKCVLTRQPRQLLLSPFERFPDSSHLETWLNCAKDLVNFPRAWNRIGACFPLPHAFIPPLHTLDDMTPWFIAYRVQSRLTAIDMTGSTKKSIRLRRPHSVHLQHHPLVRREWIGRASYSWDRWWAGSLCTGTTTKYRSVALILTRFRRVVASTLEIISLTPLHLL